MNKVRKNIKTLNISDIEDISNKPPKSPIP
jgi:hypothetical protein